MNAINSPNLRFRFPEFYNDHSTSALSINSFYLRTVILCTKQNKTKWLIISHRECFILLRLDWKKQWEWNENVSKSTQIILQGHGSTWSQTDSTHQTTSFREIERKTTYITQQLLNCLFAICQMEHF